MWVFDDRDVTVWVPAMHKGLEVLATAHGFISADIIRSVDEPGRCIVHALFHDVGSYRRAVSSAAAKMSLWPMLSDMVDQPSAFERLFTLDSGGPIYYETSLDGP